MTTKIKYRYVHIDNVTTQDINVLIKNKLLYYYHMHEYKLINNDREFAIAFSQRRKFYIEE